MREGGFEMVRTGIGEALGRTITKKNETLASIEVVSRLTSICER